MVVVEGGNVLHHVKRKGEFSWRGNVRGEYVRGYMFRRKCPDSDRSRDMDEKGSC